MIESSRYYDPPKVVIELNGQHLRVLDKAMERYNFKDVESLISFSVALLDLSENKTFGIFMDGRRQAVSPQDHLLNSDNSIDNIKFGDLLARQFPRIPCDN